MKSLALVAILLVEAVAFASDGIVTSVYFTTRITPPATAVPAALKSNEQVFYAGLQYLPESVLVLGALAVGGRELGLSEKESRSLSPLATDAYTAIAKDSSFVGVPSALSYCFSTAKPTNGHYFLYKPTNLTNQSRCIVFLHGYGGNFQFYIWALKEQFPDVLILAPSWGMSWAKGDGAYLQGMLADAEIRSGLHIRDPWLIGLSAGGYGGFSIYAADPGRYKGFISLAGVPAPGTAARLNDQMRIMMMVGLTDEMLPIAKARQYARDIKSRVPEFGYHEVHGDHFFFLGDRKVVSSTIRGFMDR